MSNMKFVRDSSCHMMHFIMLQIILICVFIIKTCSEIHVNCEHHTIPVSSKEPNYVLRNQKVPTRHELQRSVFHQKIGTRLKAVRGFPTLEKKSHGRIGTKQPFSWVSPGRLRLRRRFTKEPEPDYIEMRRNNEIHGAVRKEENLKSENHINYELSTSFSARRGRRAPSTILCNYTEYDYYEEYDSRQTVAQTIYNIHSTRTPRRNSPGMETNLKMINETVFPGFDIIKHNAIKFIRNSKARIAAENSNIKMMGICETAETNRKGQRFSLDAVTKIFVMLMIIKHGLLC